MDRHLAFAASLGFEASLDIFQPMLKLADSYAAHWRKLDPIAHGIRFFKADGYAVSGDEDDDIHITGTLTTLAAPVKRKG
jgi:hypothetical protein